MRTYSIINYENLYLFVMYCKVMNKLMEQYFGSRSSILVQFIDINLSFFKMMNVQAAFEWMIWYRNVSTENECR